MRVTTNMILRNYQSNLGNAMNNLNAARTRVMTERNFNSAAEDPAAALRASVLERKYSKNEDYISIVEDAQSFQDSQENAALNISTLAKNSSKQYGLEALNGTNQSLETREAYAAAWRGLQESLMLNLNASYEDKYIFAGTDGNQMPFELTTDVSGKQILTYRGVDVNTTDPDELKKLEEFSKETVYVDMGFGLSIDPSNSNSISPSSAFNTALPGINLVGYGQDDNGNPKNMVLLAGEIADALEEDDFDIEKYTALLETFDEGREQLLNQVTTLGTRTEFLTTTKDRLEQNRISLNEQYNNVVQIDMAQAITEYSWASYTYNAALKVGTSILSPSFIDFMS